MEILFPSRKVPLNYNMILGKSSKSHAVTLMSQTMPLMPSAPLPTWESQPDANENHGFLAGDYKDRRNLFSEAMGSCRQELGQSHPAATWKEAAGWRMKSQWSQESNILGQKQGAYALLINMTKLPTKQEWGLSIILLKIKKPTKQGNKNQSQGSWGVWEREQMPPSRVSHSELSWDPHTAWRGTTELLSILHSLLTYWLLFNICIFL